MQRRRGAIEADIGDERSRARLVVQTGEIRALMDETALLHHAQEIGFRFERVGQTRSFGQLLRRRLRAQAGERNSHPRQAAGRAAPICPRCTGRRQCRPDPRATLPKCRPAAPPQGLPAPIAMRPRSEPEIKDELSGIEIDKHASGAAPVDDVVVAMHARLDNAPIRLPVLISDDLAFPVKCRGRCCDPSSCWGRDYKW